MGKPNKIEKAVGFALMKGLSLLRPRFGTTMAIFFYGRWGMKFPGRPNYISARSWFDGTDYSLIELGEGCTISSQVSFLTHDWTLHTVGLALGIKTDKPLGQLKPISIGRYCFIGRGTILMPGAKIGEGSIIGAGSVVRGNIAAFSIVIGNPGKIIGDSRHYYEKKTGLKISTLCNIESQSL